MLRCAISDIPQTPSLSTQLSAPDCPLSILCSVPWLSGGRLRLGRRFGLASSRVSRSFSVSAGVAGAISVSALSGAAAIPRRRPGPFVGVSEGFGLAEGRARGLVERRVRLGRPGISPLGMTSTLPSAGASGASGAVRAAARSRCHSTLSSCAPGPTSFDRSVRS